MTAKRALMSVVALSLAAAVLSGLSSSVPALARDDNTDPAAPAADRIGPEEKYSGLPESLEPAVAYNWTRDEYLVVWRREHIYGGGWSISARRDSQLGSFRVSQGGNHRTRPAVAYNTLDEEYLVVWTEDVSGDGSRWAIKGKIIPWDAAGSGILSIPELTIADFSLEPRSNETPSVAYNSWRNEYLVVWNTRVTGSPPTTATAVGSRRVMDDGTMPDVWAPITTDGSPHQSDVAYYFWEDEYLVVWVRESALPPAGTGDDVWASRLSYGEGGSLDIGTPFSVTHSTKHENRPAVSTNGLDRYIVAFEYEYSDTDRDIYGQELDGAGNKVGLSPFQIASTTSDETHPDVIAVPFAGADYFAAWQRTEGTFPNTDETVWARRWGSGVTDYYFCVTPWVDITVHPPAVATDGVGRLIVYPHLYYLLEYFHIFGRTWWPEAVFVPRVLKMD